LAIGNIAGFFVASYGKEHTKLTSLASQLPALFGVAVGVDALRGSNSYLVQSLEEIGAACETRGALVALILLSFFVIGFLFMYMLKASFINPLVEQASPELIRDPQTAERAKNEGVGKLPIASVGVEAQAVRSNASDDLRKVSEDPQKGRWGLRSVNDGYVLTSMVRPVPSNPEWFEVELQVQSIFTDRPLGHFVQFHLHPTFLETDPVVKPRNGVATLSRLAWGAFTVGAEVIIRESREGSAEPLEKRIPLELDLAELPGVPQLFAQR
jgi:hypothetical protein